MSKKILTEEEAKQYGILNSFDLEAFNRLQENICRTKGEPKTQYFIEESGKPSEEIIQVMKIKNERAIKDSNLSQIPNKLIKTDDGKN